MSQATALNLPYIHSRLLTLTLLLTACRCKIVFLISQRHGTDVRHVTRKLKRGTRNFSKDQQGILL